jgi:soluble lytic murein transglycosylase
LALAAPVSEAHAQHPAPAEPPNADTLFLAMRDAVHNGDLDGAAALGRRVLQADPNYPLAAYIEFLPLAQRLAGNSDAPPDEAVRAFIAKNQGSLVAELARRDWLLALGRRGDFATFESEWPGYQGSDDAQLTCFSVMAHYLHLVHDGESLPAAFLLSAMHAISVPKDVTGDGCGALATALGADGRIDTDQIWTWARAASDANLLPALREYLAMLPPSTAPKPDLVTQVYDKSATWLAARRPGEPIGNSHELVVIALARMARASPAETVPLYERSWAARLNPQENAYIWGELALAGQRRQLPQASEWSQRSLAASELPEEVLAARVRAALHDQNWPLVIQFIEKMPPEMLKPGYGDGAWVYWLARAHAALGQTDSARPLYLSISDQFGFYGQLASEELGVAPSVPPQALPVNDAELASVNTLPGFARARKFYDLNLRGLGNQEWNFTLRGMGDRQLLASAEFARRTELFDRTVNTADRTRVEHDFSMRYLAPFHDAMQSKVSDAGLSLDWVYGLIRQESRFVLAAHSSAGASGLMQLMPNTARYVAKKIGLTDYHPEQVSDVDTNLTLGTSYLRMVMNELDNVEVLATAAYNAGPGRARSWRASFARPVEGAIYAETIPFTETRDYVKRVMSNSVYYALLFDPGKVQSLKARMGMIGPGSVAAADDLP